MPFSNDMPQAWWKRLLLLLVHIVGFLILFLALMAGTQALLELFAESISTTLWRDFILPWSAILLSVWITVYVFDRLHIGARLAQLGFVSSAFKDGSITGLWVGSSLLLIPFIVLLIGGWCHIERVDWQWQQLLLWLLFFLIQPLAEELLMRSFLQTQIHHYFGRQAGLVFTALVFGLLHANNDHFSWIAGLQIVAGGYLMGQLFLYTQSIWGPYLMHAIWNFMQSILLGFAVSGVDTYTLLELQLDGPTWLTGGEFGLEGSALSLSLIVLAIIYFWPKSEVGLPLRSQPEPIVQNENLLDEGHNI